MIKKRMMFQLMNARAEDWEHWKSMEKEVNMLALKNDVVRSNRLHDDVKHTTSVDVTAPDESSLLQAIIEISRFHEKHLSGIDVKCTQQVILENSEISFVIGAIKEQLKDLKKNGTNAKIKKVR